MLIFGKITFNSKKMESFQTFLTQYPEYENPMLDCVRENQFSHVTGVYADWTGAALPPQFLIKDHGDFLMRNALGNPHSHHAPSALAMKEVMETRRTILAFFNADPSEYEVIFTQNATGAILILQHYLFEAGELLLTEDNHNSMNGLREIAKRKGGAFRYASINNDLTFNKEDLETKLSYPRSVGNKLFGYPAKSNYSGICHNLEWVNYAQERGWDVILDAAAFVANNRLDLSKIKPDFVPISFYKIFGYPTGIGCLIIKKEKYQKLHKRWFSGGSILLVSVIKDFYAPESVGYARFEDGTVNFAGIPAIKNGLSFAEGLGDIKPRVTALASWLHEVLSGMTAGNNSIDVYNSRGNDTVAFNIKKDGKVQDAWHFEQAASEAGIYVRTGCFCDPGVNEKVFGYEIDSFERLYNSKLLPDQINIENLRSYSEKPIGAIRASFGYYNNFDDVKRFADFTQGYLTSL